MRRRLRSRRKRKTRRRKEEIVRKKKGIRENKAETQLTFLKGRNYIISQSTKCRGDSEKRSEGGIRETVITMQRKQEKKEKEKNNRRKGKERERTRKNEGNACGMR